MQRLLLVLLITTGAISLSGCGFFNRNTDVAEDPAPSTEPITQPIKKSEGKLPDIPEGEDSDGIVSISENSPTIIARDLIQSTDPNERAIGVERTRNDPFAELTIPLIPPEPIEVPEAVRASNNNVRASSNNVRASSNNAASGPASPRTLTRGSTVPAGSSRNAGGTEEGRPSISERQVESAPPEIAVLPEIPQPTTARAVRVSGVIQIGGSPYAIVKAPNEIERYVRQGERIAGGSVFVKRIDTGSIEPRVILVENGIEVERLVTAADEPVEEEEPSTEAVSTISSLPSLARPGI